MRRVRSGERAHSFPKTPHSFFAVWVFGRLWVNIGYFAPKRVPPECHRIGDGAVPGLGSGTAPSRSKPRAGLDPGLAPDPSPAQQLVLRQFLDDALAEFAVGVHGAVLVDAFVHEVLRHGFVDAHEVVVGQR